MSAKTKAPAEIDYAELWKDRFKVVGIVQERVLDPLMLLAELVRAYEDRPCVPNKVDFGLDEVCATIRLLVLGGYTELNSHCVDYGGGYFVSSGSCLEQIIEGWAENIKKKDKALDKTLLKKWQEERS